MKSARSDLARYTSFPREPGALADTVGEFARDANTALGRRVLGYTKKVTGYSATGSTATRIPLTASDKRPAGIVLVDAYAVNDPGTAVTASSVPGFYYSQGAIGVYEPSGLTLNTAYNLTFLVVEE